jgi:hypothetical protein
MKGSMNIMKIMVLVLLTAFAVALSSCSGEIGPVHRAWIDFPKQGGQFEPGSSIPITIHLTEDEGLGEVIIRVNGEVIYQSLPPRTGNPVMAIHQEWIPDLPGDYSIEVDVTDNNGITMSRAQVDIQVIGELEALKPDLAVTDIQLVGNDLIRCYYKNFGAVVLPEGSEFWLDIILGPAESEVPPEIRLNLGSGSSLVPGTEYFVPLTLTSIPSWPHLVTCRIDVDDQVSESDEDNNNMMVNLGVNLAAPPIATTETPTPTHPPPTTEPPPPTTQAPPPTTQAPPPDSSPPNISGMSASPSRIAELPCAQNTVTISAQVSDPSGVGQVKLFYRAAKGSTQGSWQNTAMTHTGGNQYQVAIGPSLISASRSPYGGLNLEYYVKAWDAVGNVGQSSTGSTPLDYCVQ